MGQGVRDQLGPSWSQEGQLGQVGRRFAVFCLLRKAPVTNLDQVGPVLFPTVFRALPKHLWRRREGRIQTKKSPKQGALEAKEKQIRVWDQSHCTPHFLSAPCWLWEVQGLVALPARRNPQLKAASFGEIPRQQSALLRQDGGER